MEAVPSPPTTSPAPACPMCGAPLAVASTRCGSCGELLGRPGVHGLWQDRGRLVMARDAQLPPICLKTNLAADEWRELVFCWHPPGWYWLYFIPAYWVLMSQRVTLRLPISERALRDGRRMRFARWLTLPLICGVFASLCWIALLPLRFDLRLLPTELKQNLTYMPLIAYAILNLYMPLFIGLPDWGLRLVYLTDTHCWLSGVHRDYLRTLPVFDGPSNRTT